MRIQAINQNLVKPIRVQNFSNIGQNNQPNDTIKHRNIGNLSAYYYPVQFQGEQKSNEIKILEAKLDEFCQENMGKHLEYVSPDFWNFELTKSRFINDRFKNEVSAVIRYENEHKRVSEETYAGALQDVLTFSYNRLYKDMPQDEQKALAKKDALEIINEYKKQNEIKEPLSVVENSPQYYAIKHFMMDAIMEKYSDFTKLPKEFLITKHMRMFHDYLDKRDIPIMNEDVAKKVKSVLKKEPFVSFNKNMLKAEAQISEAVPIEQCAADILQDSIKNKISPFENPKLYRYATSTYANLDFLFEKLYGYGYPEIKESFDASGIDPKHKVLLIDPAIVNHLSDLQAFVEENQINTSKLEPIELRRQFSDYLGTETVYRGLYSENPEQLIEKLKDEGAFAGIYRDPQKVVETIEQYLSLKDGVGETIRGRISDKIERPEEPHEFMSATSVYDIAASVPKKSGHPETPVVVIKAEVPKLSLVKQNNYFKGMQYNSYGKTLYIGAMRFPYDRRQEQIEIFVPFYLPTDNAEFIIDTHTPNFSWSEL